MTWRRKIGKELGFNVIPQIGSYIVPDEWNHGEKLISGDDWDKCQFRLPSRYGYELAVNIEITGTTLQPRFGGYENEWVRVKVTFVADDAWDWTNDCKVTDTETRGWMLVTNDEKEWI